MSAEVTELPVVDADGEPVDVSSMTNIPTDVLRTFFAGRVPAIDCPHYIAVSEARAGFEKCERC